jgi:hypothetical protein
MYFTCITRPNRLSTDTDDTSGFTVAHEVSVLEYIIVTVSDTDNNNWDNDDSSHFQDDYATFDYIYIYV